MVRDDGLGCVVSLGRRLIVDDPGKKENVYWICKQMKYIHSNEYTLRLPNKLDQPLALGLSLAEYKTNELTLIHSKHLDYEYQLNTNQLQSFDRLYRTRSESQPPKETFQEIPHDQQSMKFNTNRSSTLRPSHTSLHAYWNDPNFDTQSQISTCSSSTKKRRAPRPPGYTSPNRAEPQIVYIQQQHPPIRTPSPPLRLDHHQSHESLQSENTKKKRKAPVVLAKKDQVDKIEQQEATNNIARPGLFSHFVSSLICVCCSRFRSSTSAVCRNGYRFSIHKSFERGLNTNVNA